MKCKGILVEWKISGMEDKWNGRLVEWKISGTEDKMIGMED